MSRLMTYPRRLFEIVKFRGIQYIYYLIAGYLLPKYLLLIFKWISPRKFFASIYFLTFCLMLYGVFLIYNSYLLLIPVATLIPTCILAYSMIQNHRTVLRLRQNNKPPIALTSKIFTSWKEWPVAPIVRNAVEEFLIKHPGEEIVLGSIDNDGRLLSQFGPLPSWVTITAASYIPRYRFPLDIILKDGFVLIRKDFKGNRKKFLQEWSNLTRLMGHANVPGVYCVDENKTLLYKNVIQGRTLRDILVDAGATILNCQTEQDQALIRLKTSERLKVILARGTELVKSCFSESFFVSMEQQIDVIHRSGIAGISLTFGNIMIDDQGEPWFIDMEGAQGFKSIHHPAFLWQRDQDRKKYNQIYDQNLLTEDRAKEKLAENARNGPDWYAPIDFGDGLAIDGFWAIDSGTGRWEYLNNCVLASLINDKRILDLGSNNGIMPLMMLRNGAKEVIGIEYDNLLVKRAKLVQRIFEWRDMRRYKFTIFQQDMRDIFFQNWAPLDLVTSFCSLYYLTESDMAKVIQYSAKLAPIMVLQAKTDTRLEAKEQKSIKSSVQFLKTLLIENGFPYVEIYNKDGFVRPLIIGRRSEK